MNIIKYQSKSQKLFKLANLNVIFSVMILLLALPQSAEAYIGPGAGIGAIGTAVALMGALILIVVGFVWYPVKRFLRFRKSTNASDESEKS